MHKREAHTSEPAAVDSFGPDVRFVRQPVRDDVGARALSHGGHARVVGVEYRDAVRRQRFDEFGLRVGNRLDAPEPLHVGRTDVRDDADFRLGDVAQQRDLAARPHAHLQHRAAMPRRRLEQHQRKADLAVEVALVLQHVIADVQHSRGQFLRRRLADAAGDGDDLQLAARPAAQAGQILQCRQRVRHDVLRDIGLDGPLDDRARRPALGRVRHVVVAIDVFTPQRDEDVAAARLA